MLKPKKLQTPNLHALRERQGYSLRALAEKAGVSYNLIYLLEEGKKSTRPETAMRICEALDCSVFELCFSHGVDVSDEDQAKLRARLRELDEALRFMPSPLLQLHAANVRDEVRHRRLKVPESGDGHRVPGAKSPEEQRRRYEEKLQREEKAERRNRRREEQRYRREKKERDAALAKALPR